MRNFSQFSISGFEKRLHRTLAPQQRRVQSLMNDVVVSTTFRPGLDYFHLKGYRSSELFELAIYSWYLGDLGFLLRLDLEEKVARLEEEDKYKIPLGIVLNSLPEMLLFLKETSLWSTEDFFGTFLHTVNNPLRKLRLYKPSKKVVEPVRKRGYNDQGSRALDSAWKSARSFWEDTLLQNEIEKKRESLRQAHQFIEGFLA